MDRLPALMSPLSAAHQPHLSHNPHPHPPGLTFGISLFMEAENRGKFNNISMSVAGSSLSSAFCLLGPSHSIILNVCQYMSSSLSVRLSLRLLFAEQQGRRRDIILCLPHPGDKPNDGKCPNHLHTPQLRDRKRWPEGERKRHNRNKLMRKIEIKFSPQNVIQK